MLGIFYRDASKSWTFVFIYAPCRQIYVTLLMSLQERDQLRDFNNVLQLRNSVKRYYKGFLRSPRSDFLKYFILGFFYKVFFHFKVIFERMIRFLFYFMLLLLLYKKSPFHRYHCLSVFLSENLFRLINHVKIDEF